MVWQWARRWLRRTRSDVKCRLDRSGGRPILRFVHVDYWLDDPEAPILRDIHFQVMPGGSLVILGASGAGKTTILRLAIGLIRPSRGEIWIDGYEISRMPERQLIELRGCMGLVFQEGALFDSLTLEENVLFPLVERLHLPMEEARARAHQVLQWVGLNGHGDKLPAELSGGMRRRAGIARALVTEPDILLYDEPTAGLDPITTRTIVDLIVKLRDVRGVTSVVVTHKLEDAFRIATTRWVRRNDTWAIEERDLEDPSITTEFMVLHEGRVRFCGPLRALLRCTDPYVRAFIGKMERVAEVELR